MKRIGIIVLIVSLLFCSVFFLEKNIYQLACNKNKQESEEILKVAYNVLENENNKEKNNIINEKLQDIGVRDEQELNHEIIDNQDDILGVLIIEKLQVEAPIKEGTSQEILKTAIGHFSESDYWNGNVSLASHNSGTSAHYFEKIKYLKVNDTIKYITKLGTRNYCVQNIYKIENTDWSMIVKNNGKAENTLTLITCITGQPKYRLCVRAIEV